MKTKKGIVAILAVLIIAFYLKPIAASAQNGAPVTFQVFYDNLSPYGQWTEMPAYGYVWIPDVAPGFTPYGTNGYWANTDMGWTWVSNYEWGWAPFHYGRWERDYNIGWYWVPGYEWAPAWVAWRQSPGYFGWAPMRPGIDISIVTGGRYNPEPEFWVFANERYMGDHYIYNYYAPVSDNVVIINRSSWIHETYVDRDNRGVTYFYGPRREVVERYTGNPVQRVVFVERNRPGHYVSGNEISIYRPHVERRDNVRPVRVEEVKRIRPERERQENYEKRHPEERRREEKREERKEEHHDAEKRREEHKDEHKEERHDPINDEHRNDRKDEHKEPEHKDEHKEPDHNNGQNGDQGKHNRWDNNNGNRNQNGQPQQNQQTPNQRQQQNQQTPNQHQQQNQQQRDKQPQNNQRTPQNNNNKHDNPRDNSKDKDHGRK